MNTVVTSKEAILKCCREIVSEQGLSALNMRDVAHRCEVALGSLYNYFPSKETLIAATVESVWRDIFHMEKSCNDRLSFVDEVTWFFERVQKGITRYPNFFTAHSLALASGEKNQGRARMEQYFSHMTRGLLRALEEDKAVRNDAFSEVFPPADFVEFVFSSLLSLLVRQKENCHILTEMIRRTLYL